jgi:tetratricopeptide (TPR) repeat protein
MRKTLSSRWPALLALALCLVLSAGCGKAAKARRLLAAANSDFQAQKYDAAELEYQSARRLAPLDPTAIRQLGFIFFDEGRPQEAFAFLKKSLEQDPKNTEVQLKMAELYGGSRNFKEAADLLGSVLRSDPANERALVLLAEISPSNSLPSLSQRLETQLREGGQGAAACRSALGWIDLRMRKPADAEAEFQKASALDPKLATPYLGQATLCAMRKDLKGVGQALQTAAKLSPVRSNARMKYAEFKAEIGADAEAKEILRDITRQAPDYIPAWLSLMKMYFAERQYDECQTAVDSVLARDKFNFEALLQSGDLALARREAAKSLSDFQRMDEIFKKGPQAAQVKYHLALAYLLNNEKQKGMANLNETLALDSSFSAAALLLAELDFRSGNLTESVTLLTQLIKKHPDNAQARLTLAEAYLAQKRPDRALEVYQQMAKMFPKNPEIPRRMGMV